MIYFKRTIKMSSRDSLRKLIASLRKDGYTNDRIAEILNDDQLHVLFDQTSDKSSSVDESKIKEDNISKQPTVITDKIAEFLSPAERANWSNTSHVHQANLMRKLKQEKEVYCKTEAKFDSCGVCTRDVLQRFESGPGYDEYCIAHCKDGKLCGRLASKYEPDSQSNSSNNFKLYCDYHFGEAAAEAAKEASVKRRERDLEILGAWNR